MTLAVIYDGQCVICTQSKRFYSALDWFKRIEFLDLHQPETLHQRFPQISYEAAMGQMHLIAPDGSILAGFPAVKHMLKVLPLTFPVWLLLNLPGMDFLGNRAYRFIARNRYRINRWAGAPVCDSDTCRIIEG